MTVLLVLAALACVVTWHKTRQRTGVRVTRSIRLELARQERVAQFKRNIVIGLAVAVLIVILAMWR